MPTSIGGRIVLRGGLKVICLLIRFFELFYNAQTMKRVGIKLGRLVQFIN